MQVELKKLVENNYGYSEAVKNLRTNVQFSGSDVKVIAFTSSLPGEGKTDVAYALTQSFVQIGKKVLFIDADIRKSVLAARLELREEVPGLSEYLSGQSELSDVICRTNYEGLDFIFSGKYSPAASELLEEERFTRLIAEAKETYDYVFVDTPPLGVVTDCAVIAKSVDGIIFIIESGAISYHLLQKVKAQLDTTGTRVLGVVLNKVDASKETYYGKYGKYGRYGKYSRYDKYGRYGAYGVESKE